MKFLLYIAPILTQTGHQQIPRLIIIFNYYVYKLDSILRTIFLKITERYVKLIYVKLRDLIKHCLSSLNYLSRGGFQHTDEMVVLTVSL